MKTNILALRVHAKLCWILRLSAPVEHVATSVCHRVLLSASQTVRRCDQSERVGCLKFKGIL